MALTTGARLGSYEILSALGAGGMGEVYRAADTRLKRQVAVKVLPPLLASDPDRLARFRREAEILASLNHPNIAAIHGLEEADGVHALVMELVEGEDLAQRIARGPVPVDDALPIAQQIAEALEAAHDAGVIHRDLKPANIKVRPDGTVKILDFGLAKLAESDGTSGAGKGVPSQSPTITTPAMMTGVGMILGTAAYMSPEQARGFAADKRADIWAFGAVVFEMLTGERAFTGDTISDTLASVLKTEPNWQALPQAIPLRLPSLLRWCLTKDPKRRLRDVGDARVQLEDLIAGGRDEADPGLNKLTALAAWRRLLPWALTGVLAAALVMLLIAAPPWRQSPQPALVRMDAQLGGDVSLVSFLAGDAIALSRDGKLAAFVGQRDANKSAQIYVRRLNELNEREATPLGGTEGADSPFFSPDGQWVAFFADGKLKKVAVKGGATITLCDAPISRGGDWGDDGTIVFLPNRLGTLMRVSADAGGTPQVAVPLAAGEVSQRWPQVLPGGDAILFTSSGGAPTNWNEANIVVQKVASRERRVLQKAGYHGRYLSSGHLVFLRDGTLFAAPFDLDSLTVKEPTVPVIEGVTSNGGTGSAWFAASPTGLFAYVPGASTSAGIPISWMDREGKMTTLRATRAPWLNLRFSPDGERVAFQIQTAPTDIWIYEWARDSLTRLTSDPAADTDPVWTPDGRRVTFSSTRGNGTTGNIYWQRFDESGNAVRLTNSPNLQQPRSWHPSGRFLAFEEVNAATNTDLMILPMEGDEASGWKPGNPIVFANTPFDERHPAFSPDGRWLAYVSNDTGQNEVYVRAFQGPGKWKISAGGGLTPTWSRNKRELYYGVAAVGAGFGQIFVVPYTVEGNSFRPGKAQLWSPGRYQTRGPSRMFDLHPDGLRVAIAPADDVAGTVKRNHLTFLLNFFDELTRVSPRAQ
jgi:Tol biopolymer transport system component